MQLSIIIPVYNRIDMLTHCIQSIVKSNSSEWELILIDDGSTDGSGALCDMWARKDKRIHVIHQANAGAATARNHGIRKASGTYICCIDSDDFVSSHYLDELLHVIDEKNPDVILVNAKKISQDTVAKDFDWVLNEKETSEQLKRIALGGYMGETWRKIWKKDLIQGDLFPAPLKSIGDLYATADIMRAAKTLSVLPRAYYVYNQMPHASIMLDAKAADKNYNKFLAWKHYVEVGKSAYWEEIHPAIPEFHRKQARLYALKAFKCLKNSGETAAWLPSLQKYMEAEGLPDSDMVEINKTIARDTLRSIELVIDFIHDIPTTWVFRHFKNLVKVYAMDCAGNFLTPEERQALQKSVQGLLEQKSASHMVFGHRMKYWMIRHHLQFPFTSQGKEWLTSPKDFMYNY
jgi:glycosyltransferase involved in cell wall biosynthesis